LKKAAAAPKKRANKRAKIPCFIMVKVLEVVEKGDEKRGCA
jgi:hypothetical protein